MKNDKKNAKGKYQAKNNQNKGRSKPKSMSKSWNKDVYTGSNDMELDPKRTNHPAWYFKNPQLNKDSASFNFSQALGLPVDVSQNTGANGVHGGEFIVPGICAIKYIPGIGYNNPSTSTAPTAVDLAAQSTYSFVVHANSRTKQYDIPDLMMYYMACVDLYAGYSDLVRAYGIARWYNVYNRYYPSTVLKALGYDPDDVIQHLAEFRYQINQMAVALTSLCVPNNFTIFNRQTWLPQNLFQDHPGLKSQTYAFVPLVLHEYKPYSSIKGGYLKGFDWYSLPWSAKCAKLRSMIGDLLSNQDIGMMSGDTLKAFGEGNLIRVNTINEDYVTVPTYDEVVLTQIENLTVVGGHHYVKAATTHVPAIDTVTDIYQDPDVSNRLVYTPKIYKDNWFSTSYSLLQKIINIRHDNPTDVDLFEATRLSVIGSTDEEEHDAVSAVGIDLNVIGTEIVAGLEFYDFEIVSGFEIKDNILPLYPDDATANKILIHRLSKLFSFRFHPSIYIMEAFSSGDDPNALAENIRPMIDWANYTVLDRRELNNMHQTALLSMYDVPISGTMK